MMDWRIVFVLGLFTLAVNASGYFFVTAPNMLRYKTDEHVLVSVFDRTNADITIWLEYDYLKYGDQKTKEFSKKKVRVLDQNTPRLETIRVDENDIFDPDFDKAIKKPGKLRLVASDGTTQKHVDIMLSYDSGYLIVHTDKPIYTPRQNVNVRVLALDESMSNALALETNQTTQVVLDLVSPDGKIMSRAYGKPSNNRGKTPFYTSKFDIPANTELGTWTIETHFTGQFETSERTMFEVDEYVLPTINVTVTTSISYILETTENFNVTVEAKYVYLKPVAGSVGLTFFLNGEEDQKPILNQPRTHLSPDGVHVFTINANKIVNSDLRKEMSGRFPKGEYLTIRADVFESATGNEETGLNTDLIFADKPYKFTYERSQVHFRPGWVFMFKVDVLLPNDDRANDVTIKVSYTLDGKTISITKTTDNIGQCNIAFSTKSSSNQRNITFEVVTEDGVIDTTFKVQPYIGTKQVKVDQIEQENKVWIQMKNNMGEGATGLLFVIMSRGKILKWKYTDSTNEDKFELEKEILTKISPTARVLVFYVDNDEVVADSVKFDVKAVCRGKELKLETKDKEANPGDTGLLTIEGPSDMMVGLNVMDTALLLLNSENILRRTKMFKAMASHDRGCGEGSGSTVETVFKNSGLTLVTDATISTDGLKREFIKCRKNNRRKRSLETECSGPKQLCCNEGMTYAFELVEMKDYNIEVDCYAMCKERAASFNKTNTPTECLYLIYDVCVAEFLEQTTGASNAEGRSSLDGESDYNIDLKKLKANKGSLRHQRNDFRESWLFTDVDLKDGKAPVILKYPDSITQWMIQAIGFSPRDGMCIANPLYVKAKRDFFIQLDLPYQAVKLERIYAKATIFNYGIKGTDDKTINVYLHGQKDMCSAAKAGQTSQMVQLRMAPNTAKTVTIPFIPLKSSTPGKQLDIHVTAIAEGTIVNDAISKKLYIINEGIETSTTIHVCLDPAKEKDDCKPSDKVTSFYDNAYEQRQTITIDLSLPKEAIPDTGTAIAQIKSNLMVDAVETIVNGVDKLIRMPYGCGEQNIIRLAPATYAMNYLKQTKQVTDKIEQEGNIAIRNGVTHEMQYQKSDGSYAIWTHIPSSTWLTAFVAKVFCQAKTVVDDAVDDAIHIAPTVNWLANQQSQVDGSFDDKRPVFDRSLVGKLSENDPTLTAFVLISLLECQTRTRPLNEVTNKSQTFIEQLDVDLLRSDPYLLAISAYALSLSNSTHKDKFWNMLNDTKQTNEDNTYWGDITPTGTPANADTVETTAYALLTYLLHNQLRKAAPIVRWLTSQRNAGGSFKSTQDTVVGLQALSEYSIVTESTEVNLQLTFSADGWDESGHTETVTKENINVLKIMENLPVQTKDNQLIITVTGTGSARMDIDLRYNTPKPDTPCFFKVSEIEIKTAKIPKKVNLGRKCDVCGYCNDPENPSLDALVDDHTGQAESNFGRRKRQVVETKNKICMSFNVSISSVDQKESGMSIVKVNLQTGMQAIKDDLEKLQKKGIIDRYELTYNKQGFIVFYLDKIGHDAKEFKFRLDDEFAGDADTRQGSSVDVYDYYRPDKSCQVTYGFGKHRGPLTTECSADYRPACICLRKFCAKKPDLKWFKDYNRFKPAIKLVKRTCNSNVADYSILVKITDTFDADTLKKASATVLKVFNRGAEPLKKDDEITFNWKLDCLYPNLVKDKKYYVIAKDGHRTNTNGTIGYTYPLQDKAYVINQTEETLKAVSRLMKVYEKRMKKTGCNA